MSFLHERTQHVNIESRNSIYLVLRAGTPQGTRSEPNDFKLPINNLRIAILTMQSTLMIRP